MVYLLMVEPGAEIYIPNDRSKTQAGISNVGKYDYQT